MTVVLTGDALRSKLRETGGWLVPAEVAELFRVDPKTVSRWGTAGEVPSIQTPGRHRRYSTDVIRERLYPDGMPDDGPGP